MVNPFMTEGSQFTTRAAVSPQVLSMARRMLSMSVDLPVSRKPEQLRTEKLTVSRADAFRCNHPDIPLSSCPCLARTKTALPLQ